MGFGFFCVGKYICLKLRSVELKKKISIGEKNSFAFVFQKFTHPERERERETWSLPLLLACVSVAFEHPLRLLLRPLPDRRPPKNEQRVWK